MKNDFQTELTIRLAKSWNNLDLKFVKNNFADDIVYESQLVFSSICGKQAVKSYFEGKFNSIKNELNKGLMSIKAEIATHPSATHPFIVLTQITHGEERRLSILLTVENSEIKRIDACIIPAPETARLTGEIPK